MELFEPLWIHLQVTRNLQEKGHCKFLARIMQDVRILQEPCKNILQEKGHFRARILLEDLQVLHMISPWVASRQKWWTV